MYIEFNITCLRDRIKILSIFNPHGTLWCDGKKCEIVITSEFKICIEIPFIKSNITKLTSFNITYVKIGELTLKNSISDDNITLVFNEDNILTKEVKIENSVFYISPKYTNINSISYKHDDNNSKLNLFETVSKTIISPKLSIIDKEISDNLKPIVHSSGSITIKYMVTDSFKGNNDSEYKYILDPSTYNNIAAIFKIDMNILTNFIKKLIATKTSYVEIEFFNNHLNISAFRNDNIKNSKIDESKFSVSLIHVYKYIDNKYKISSDLFCLLRKLNISISDFSTKDKKIYNSIQFNVIMDSNDSIIGICIYPGMITEEHIDEIKKYFIFMPILKYDKKI